MPIAGLALFGVSVQLISLDGLVGEFLALGSRAVGRTEDTLHAPGYSYWGFRSVKPGMTYEQVRALLGEPLAGGDLSRGGDEIWWYSESPSSSDF